MELIERHDALDALAEALAGARRGTGEVVLNGAEAGGGKSMVVEGFLDSLPTDARVRRGWCDAPSTPRPLGPFLDMGSRELQTRLLSATNRSEILAVVLDLLVGDAPQVMTDAPGEPSNGVERRLVRPVRVLDHQAPVR